MRVKERTEIKPSCHKRFQTSLTTFLKRL